MSTSILSPLASPFLPFSSGNEYQYFGGSSSASPEFAAIYNNGVPSMVVTGDHNHGGECTVLHNLSDETIEELFPPSAEEAAELDSVDSFVEVLADLSILEESEEKARHDFGKIAGKRWEVRREQGLVGRPKPARTTSAESSHHLGPMNEKETSLVGHDQKNTIRLRKSIENNRIAARVKMDLRQATPKNVRGFHGNRPIQQPRKF